jgi:hypothetical protein
MSHLRGARGFCDETKSLAVGQAKTLAFWTGASVGARDAVKLRSDEFLRPGGASLSKKLIRSATDNILIALL